ncbi:unnamed protein product [Diatraea saccharalis]|uniref:Uncharacterized protein n=1 Tax=Diatraea saccharalis TaxID=40085 RepID=A0A9N9N4G1_9NEOP|nr:unnamed protein product [Diatraea saccharalis]
MPAAANAHVSHKLSSTKYFNVNNYCEKILLMSIVSATSPKHVVITCVNLTCCGESTTYYTVLENDCARLYWGKSISPYFLPSTPQPFPPYDHIRPSKAGSALVSPLVLQVSMGDDNHLPSGDPSARLPTIP